MPRQATVGLREPYSSETSPPAEGSGFEVWEGSSGEEGSGESNREEAGGQAAWQALASIPEVNIYVINIWRWWVSLRSL